MRDREAGEKDLEILICPARACDAANIARIHVQSFKATYRREVPAGFLQSLDAASVSAIWSSRIEQLTAEQKSLWVAIKSNQLHGFCYAGPVAKKSGVAMIHSLHVMPDSQRMGAGGLLLSTATQALFQLSMQVIELWVVVTNEAAIEFYEKYGWVREGTHEFHSLSLDGGIKPQVNVVLYRLIDCGRTQPRLGLVRPGDIDHRHPDEGK